MARRAQPVRPPSAGAVPPEIAVGPLLEVWGRPGDTWTWGPPRHRWRAAREAWLAAQGISDHDGWAVIPCRGWWSIAHLEAEGRLEEAERRLRTRAGVEVADVPMLRRAAEAWSP